MPGESPLSLGEWPIAFALVQHEHICHKLLRARTWIIAEITSMTDRESIT